MNCEVKATHTLKLVSHRHIIL